MGGARRVIVEAGQRLPGMTWAEELAEMTDASPYLCPAFLSAAERVLPELRPFHTVARRGRGELAVLPGYVLDGSPAADHDPRTYLGWQPPTGEDACCAADLQCGQAAEVDALGAEALFPSLLLGSPLGYRTGVAFNFWTPALFGQMVARLVPAALEAGIRSIVAPWIPANSGNAELVGALVSGGAHASFWGYEDFIQLRTDTWEAHMAGLPARMRQRITGDQRRAAASGTDIQRIDGEQIRPHLSRIAELTCLNREKNGAGEQPARVAAMLGGLLDSGVDLRAYLGLVDGQIIASCVVLRKEHRLFPKWGGFDYGMLGEHSGLYFALGLDAPVRDAFTEELRAVEFGAGAHRAKKLRGCSARTITTVLLVADEAHRPTAARLQDACGEARRAVFDDSASAVSSAPLVAVSGSLR